MLHTALITVHASAGVIALVAGSISIRRRGFLPVYFWSLVVCMVSLATAVAYDWNSLTVALRAVFAALAGLGVFVIWQGAQARRLAPAEPSRPSGRYLDHLGFTLVALFDAFLVITVLDLGTPLWAVVATAIAIAIAGNRAVAAVKVRFRAYRSPEATNGRRAVHPGLRGP